MLENFLKLLRKSWINGLFASSLIRHHKRYKFYRLLGMNIEKSRIRFGCTFDGEKPIEIKQGVFINSNVYFDCNERILIGENTFIGNDVAIITTTHVLERQEKRAGQTIYLPVKIGRGCWIGARSTILPNVTIGDGCVIAAGSVVNKDCEPNGMYAGVPAKRIKKLLRE